jgi:hypothetical protein
VLPPRRRSQGPRKEASPGAHGTRPTLSEAIGTKSRRRQTRRWTRKAAPGPARALEPGAR